VADLEDLDDQKRRRALDVLSGIAYALDAKMTRYQDPRHRYLLTRTRIVAP
jgi:FtsZ-interacting cell division protein YlmF